MADCDALTVIVYLPKAGMRREQPEKDSAERPCRRCFPAR
jgi:hypothetical protein